jgi:hypothetical protein
MFCLQFYSIIIFIIIIIVITTITVTATPNTDTALNIFFVNITHIHDLHDSTDFVAILLLNGMFKYHCVFCYDLFPAFDPLSTAYAMTVSWHTVVISML